MLKLYLLMETKHIWNQYANDVKYFIISNVKNQTIADDILQNTFIKIHTKKNTIKESSKLKFWIFTIAKNEILNYYKVFKSIEINLPQDVECFEENFVHTEQDCLQGILKKLPEKYKTPLFLYDIKGMKQKEIAHQLQLPLSTVKSQIQRGRKLIAKGFMNCCGFVLNKHGKLVGEVQDKEDCKACN